MPVRAVCKPHSPDLKRGALATDARGCSLWRFLLERPPPAPASRVRDPLGELVRTRVGVTHGISAAADSSKRSSAHSGALAAKEALSKHLEQRFSTRGPS